MQSSHMGLEEGGVSSFCVPSGLVWALLYCMSVSSNQQGHDGQPPSNAGFHLLSCIDFNCLWISVLLSKKVASIYILLGSFKYSTSLTTKYSIIRIMAIIIIGNIYRATSHMPASVITIISLNPRRRLEPGTHKAPASI